MKITVIGTGYVGLVVGACLAENGNEVVCVDKDKAKISALPRGRIPIYEPGLEELVCRNRNEKRLRCTTALSRAVRSAQVIFIAVGTPAGEDGSADLRHVLNVAKDLARSMNGYKVIVTKSTVPVGTATRIREVVRPETTHPFSVVSNPEFLKQGNAINDFMKPDRVVIGAEDPRAAELKELAREMSTSHGDSQWYEIAQEAEQAMKNSKNIIPNVDYYAAIVLYQLGFQLNMMTNVVASTRIAGWSAHILEQYNNNRLIRPRALYTGERGKKHRSQNL